jgi:hypothetical protein
VLVYQDYGFELAVISAGLWLFGYGILYQDASP